ncbi:hypothetical protein PMI16_02603 [Herbaspirillum sp. CF444]|nr:hypothetical protein PMI16_02603 [Herbaspirillum sp. CF444]
MEDETPNALSYDRTARINPEVAEQLHTSSSLLAPLRLELFDNHDYSLAVVGYPGAGKQRFVVSPQKNGEVHIIYLSSLL